jgi:hypothetical protein
MRRIDGAIKFVGWAVLAALFLLGLRAAGVTVPEIIAFVNTILQK